MDNFAWCTNKGVPRRLIDHLCKTRDVYGALLHAFCILPNHVHLVLCPGPKGLSKFMQSLKSNSAKNLRTVRGLENFRWQTGFYDERIRDSNQRSSAMAYVQGNAMKHRLVSEIIDWPWTSLRHPEAVDLLEPW